MMYDLYQVELAEMEEGGLFLDFVRSLLLCKETNS